MSHSYALQRLLNFLVELFRNEAGGLDLLDPRVEPKNEIKTSWLKRGSTTGYHTEKLGQFNRPHAENVSLPSYVYFCGNKRANGTCLQCGLAELNSGISGLL